MTSATAAGATRYEALDSWRGVAATMVATFHFDVFSHFQTWLLVRNGTLYVDFFFVLSGFVITANYLERLRQGFGLGRFMLLRAARVWPLHVFMLGLFVLTELLFQPLISAYSPTGREAFSGANNVETILANFFLIHAMNLSPLSWNVPSWSISVEFFTYLLFGLAVLVFRNRIGAFAVCALIAFPVVFIATPGLDMGAATDWGILRCAYGFCAGGVIYAVFMGDSAPIRALKAAGPVAGTALEMCAIVVTAVFIAYGKYSFVWNFTPFFFAFTVVVFAAERGLVSRALRLRPFLMLGVLSYSIYMVHYFILLRIRNVAQLSEKVTETTLFTDGVGDEGLPAKLLGTDPWIGDVLTFATLGIVAIASYLTWRFIEMPGQKAGRRLAARFWDSPRRAAA